jgi:hypothetical protein
MGKNGGKRPGAGRPKGSTNKVTIYDYWGKEEIDEYFDFLRDNYKEDSKLMVFVGEQLMGKAPQRLEHSGPDGAPIPLLNVIPRHHRNQEDTPAE